MDSSRFGRVLGIGARHAAKTLVSAVDAATSPAPKSRSTPVPVPAPPHSPTPNPPSAAAQNHTAARPTPPTATNPEPPPRRHTEPELIPPPRQPAPSAAAPRPAATPPRPSPGNTARGLAEGSRRFGRAVWGPTVRLSGVLWLELTGVFFGLFALVAAIAIWRLRESLHQPGAEHTHLLLALLMLVVFGYFCISSFRSAGRRSRER